MDNGKLDDSEHGQRKLGDSEEEIDWNSNLAGPDSTIKEKFCGFSQKEIPVTHMFQHGRTIIHIDIDCFYAQVEMIRNPELREKPLGIQQKNIMVTCNYKARQYGLTKLMGIKDAKQKCPQLILVNGEDLTPYRQMSYNISELLLEHSSFVERLGFDENFVDVTELVEERLTSGNYNDDITGHIYQQTDRNSSKLEGECDCGCHVRLVIGSQIADDIRASLNSHLHVTCCAGVAHNKLLSKLVAGAHKPNQQTTLFPKQAESLLSSLKVVSKIPGIGLATSKHLNNLGVHSIQDLRDISVSVLADELGGSIATSIQQLSHGIDDSPVSPYGRPQTLSDEDSFKKCSSVADVQCKMHELLQNLLVRLIEDGRIPHTVRLTIRKCTLENKWTNRESRQCPVPCHVFSAFGSETMEKVCSQLQPVLLTLFKRLVDILQPFNLTLINVAFCKLAPKPKNSIRMFFSRNSDVDRTDLVTESQKHSIEEKDSTDQFSLDSIFRPSLTSLFDNNTDSLVQKAVRNANIEHNEVSCSKRKRQCITKNGGFFAKKLKSSTSVATESKDSSNVATESVHSNVSKVQNVGSKSFSIPIGIDKNIFNELPLDIQEEIKAEYSNMSEEFENCTSDLKDTTASIENSHFSSDTKFSLDYKVACSNEDDSPNLGTDCAGSRSSNIHQQLHTRILPSHVDSQVFADLPPEIRAELLQQWKFVDKVIPNTKKLKPKSGKSPEKNKTKVKSTNISNFFKKS